MGGWTCQVHLHQDVISETGLQRSALVIEKLIRVADDLETGCFRVPPAYGLADSLMHRDHRIMPADEIDPDYIDRDERPHLLNALVDLGCTEKQAQHLAAPYDTVLGACFSAPAPPRTV